MSKEYNQTEVYGLASHIDRNYRSMQAYFVGLYSQSKMKFESAKSEAHAVPPFKVKNMKKGQDHMKNHEVL